MSDRNLNGRELIKAWVSWKSRSEGERYTFKALADDAGLNQNYLSNVMTGIRNPGGKTLEKIAGAFGVGIGEFYQGPPKTASGHHTFREETKTGPSETIPVQYQERSEQPFLSVPVSPQSQQPSPDREPDRILPQKSEFVSLKLGGNESEEISRLFSNLGFEAGEMLTSDSLSSVLGLSSVNDQDRYVSQNDQQQPAAAPQDADGEGESRISPAPDDARNTAKSQKRIDIPDNLPLLSSVYMGSLDEWLAGYNPDSGEYMTAPRYFGSDSEHAFAVVIDDDSMVPDLNRGDILVVDCDKAFTRIDGGLGVAVTPSGVKVRRVFLQNGSYNLIPSNTSFSPDIVPESETVILKVVLWIPLAEGKF